MWYDEVVVEFEQRQHIKKVFIIANFRNGNLTICQYTASKLSVF